MGGLQAEWPGVKRTLEVWRSCLHFLEISSVLANRFIFGLRKWKLQPVPTDVRFRWRIRLGNVFLVNYTESSPNEERDGRKITKMHFPQRKLSN